MIFCFLLQRAVDDADDDDDAEIEVVIGVDQQRLERRVARIAGLRRGQARDDRFEHGVDADAGLGGNLQGVGGVEADHVLDLLLHARHVGGGQVDLVEDRHDLVVVVDRLVDVGEGLRLDALRCIDDQQRAFAGGKAARDLVGEVDVAGRVHQVEDVGLAVLRRVVEADGLRLDGDAALALDVHVVEHLLDHVALGEAAGHLDDAVGQRRLAVVDVGDDREVSDLVPGSHAGASSRGRPDRQCFQVVP